MRLLILGGTWFVGRGVAEAALAEGFEVTCFNRGRSGVDVDGVQTVRGDRTSAEDLERLAGHGPWDAVIDTGAYEPATTRLATNALAGVTNRYLMVSTVSAYVDWPAESVDEASPLWPARPDARESDSDVAALPVPAAYGTLKAGCEAVVEAAFGDRALVFRPGVVLGPYEYVGRLDALLRRAAAGGRMLVAGDPQRPIQPVDVRDLAAFALSALTRGLGGAYNVVAPREHATYGELIATCVEVTGAIAEPVWVDPPWLVERGLREWTQLVLWRTPAGTWDVDGRRARAAGLSCRPLAKTVRDTWAWLGHERPVVHERSGEHGIPPDVERALLDEWESSLLGRRG